MIKEILKKKRFQYFLGWLISIYLKFCYHSSIWYIKNNQNIKELISKKKSFLVCFWHNRILMAPFCWEDQEKKFKMLISSHPDGRIISHAVSYFGISTISGSSRKNTLSSIKEILNEIKNNNIIGITPDGPKGPKEKVKPGLLNLLKKNHLPIIPLSYSAKFNFRLNTWDKFLFVTPFNKFVAVWGEPFFYNKKESDKKNILNLEKEIQRISDLSDNLVR